MASCMFVVVNVLLSNTHHQMDFCEIGMKNKCHKHRFVMSDRVLSAQYVKIAIIIQLAVK